MMQNTNQRQKNSPAYPNEFFAFNQTSGQQAFAPQPGAQPAANQSNNSLQRTGAPGSLSGPALNMPQYQRGPSSTNVLTQFGNFPTLQAFQNQQDAFVQQFNQNQASYNTGLMAGQSPTRVPLMQAWSQAGDNIASGQYQGNPFATGNVDAIMSMFDQYGMQTPDGFRDQLIQFLGPQAPPSALPPQIGGGPVQTGAPHWQPQIGTPVARNPWAPKWGDPGYPVPDMGQQPSDMNWGGPSGQVPGTDGFSPPPPGIIPKFVNPATGLPYGQQPGMQPGMGQQPISNDYAPKGTPQMFPNPGPGLVPFVLSPGAKSQKTVYVTPEAATQLQEQARVRNDPQANAQRVQAEQDAILRDYWVKAGMPGYERSQPAFQVITDGWSNPNQSEAYQNWLISQGRVPGVGQQPVYSTMAMIQSEMGQPPGNAPMPPDGDMPIDPVITTLAVGEEESWPQPPGPGPQPGMGRPAVEPPRTEMMRKAELAAANAKRKQQQDEQARRVAEIQAETGHIPMTSMPGEAAMPWTPELGKQGYNVTSWRMPPRQLTQPAQAPAPKPPQAPAAKPAPVGQASPIPERTQGTPLKRPAPAKKKPSAKTREGDRKSQALLNQAMAFLRSGGRP